MKKLFLQLKARHWDTLSATEQKTIMRGSWVLLPLLMYGLLWQPAHQALPRLQAALPHLRAQADQMQTLAGQAQSLRQQAQLAVLDSDALRVAVEKSAKETSLPLLVVPGELNSVRISVDNISFRAMAAMATYAGKRPAYSRVVGNAGRLTRSRHGQGAGHADQRG